MAKKSELLAKLGRLELRRNVIGELVLIDVETNSGTDDEGVVRMSPEEAASVAAELARHHRWTVR